MYYEINETAARLAHDNMSQSDYKPGSATAEYRRQVDTAAALVERKKASTSAFYHARLDALLDSYSRTLALYYNRENEIGTRCASVLVAGPANFPVRKKQKQIAAWDANRENWRKAESLLDKIKAVGRGPVDLRDPHAAEMLTEQLQQEQKALDTCKAVNAYYRKYKTVRGCEAISAEAAERITADMENFSFYGKPCPDYELSSIRGKIKRLQARLDELTSRQDTAEDITGDGWTYTENAEAQRVQFLFDGKPSEDVRSLLKAHGFRWAPSQGAWQRQLTDNGKRAAEAVRQQLRQM